MKIKDKFPLIYIKLRHIINYFFNIKIKKISIPFKKKLENRDKELNVQKLKNSKIQNQLTLDYYVIKVPKINNENLFENLTKEKLQNLKIICWNINGLPSIINKRELQYLIEKEKSEILCLKKTKIDIITLRKEKYVYKP